MVENMLLFLLSESWQVQLAGSSPILPFPQENIAVVNSKAHSFPNFEPNAEWKKY